MVATLVARVGAYTRLGRGPWGAQASGAVVVNRRAAASLSR
jgi:hypothetical protein